MTFTITVDASSKERFKADLDKAIEGLQRMKAEMFKPLPKEMRARKRRK